MRKFPEFASSNEIFFTVPTPDIVLRAFYPFLSIVFQKNKKTEKVKK